ncbi:MAG: cation transporter [SAR202 cluster bacterium]|nr:cation diffusion facilitator family transporter [Dehalococcoidia bacterium]MQG49668.1 cation transporter [SAR202 cluster bacterium]MQG78421.1 cation transporter [SAR202 cluster bacterium]|tara:strand:+ start:1045 stop:2016 length:972 start_codon:yes stop_codon:yes gene_type:complete
MDSSQQSILSPPGHAHDHRSASRRSLSFALALIMVYMVVEVVGGLISGSLALLADAGHMLTDGAAIGLALLAIWVSGRPASIEQTFGFHRTEILAAMLNALSLWLISALIFFEASRRLNDDLQVDGGLMLGVGAVGLLVNLAAAWALHRSSGESLNVEGAFLHVVADLLGSVAVVAGGILVLAFEWNIADPIFGIVIGVLILASSLRLLWKVVHVLMEGTPSHLDLHHLCQRLEELEGVTGVHDIHAWTITTGYDALSAHVTADPTVMQDPNPVLQALRDIASSEFGIGHVTIQLEDSKDGCVEDHHIEHPAVHDSSHRHDES